MHTRGGLGALRRRLTLSKEGKRVLSDGAWVAIGQLLSALGLLVGIRVLTELVAPSVFGTISLLVGVVNLGSSVFCGPQLQALSRFYPEQVRVGQAPRLRATVGHALRWISAGIVVVVLLAGVGVRVWTPVSYGLIAGLAILAVAEIWRTFEITQLAAARRQGTVAVWQAAESWARTALAVAAVLLLGATPQAVIAGYLAATLALLGFVWWRMPRETGGSAGRDPLLAKDIRRYALPLMPLAVVGWVSGLSDRYIIGGLMGVEAVGVYTAAYALISRPFLMAGGIIESTLRPVYYEAVAWGKEDVERKTLRVWLRLTAGTCVLGVLAVIVLNPWIGALLLAEQYRAGEALMPWIAGGYALLAIAYVFEKTCYAHKRTVWVTVAQTAGAIASIVVGIPLVYVGGLYGAAVAVPLYFGIQMLVALIGQQVVERTRRHGESRP